MYPVEAVQLFDPHLQSFKLGDDASIFWQSWEGLSVQELAADKQYELETSLLHNVVPHIHVSVLRMVPSVMPQVGAEKQMQYLI